MHKSAALEGTDSSFIREGEIYAVLSTSKKQDALQIKEIIAKSRELKGLEPHEIAVLSHVSDPELIHELFSAARYVKETIYGKRLVLFAPLYVSNLCSNDCTYCAFRARNTSLVRKALSQDDIAREVSILTRQGHKRVLLVAGESYPREGFQYVLDSIKTIYDTKSGSDEIRRVNVNVAPLGINEFRALKETGIGTYQLFQETYHPQTYKNVHLGGKKKDYSWRVTAMHRAMEAGIDDVGVGILFGLTDWRFEILALMQHIAELEKCYGVGPHTISVPRLEPAIGSDIAANPPMPVSDFDFRKIVAILRLAVPYTGIIMSTRETADIRRETFALGVSQISAGSRTNPGGYAEAGNEEQASQFSLGDHRSLEEVVADVASMGYIPSFCTACYRLGRTGKDFMDLAKPGEIKNHCDPNGLCSFEEYLVDYASTQTRELGENLIRECIAAMKGFPHKASESMVKDIKAGKRDVYV